MKKLIISARFHPDINKWSSLSVEMGKKGTHDNYNVLFNSECHAKYYDSEENAKADAVNNSSWEIETDNH